MVCLIILTMQESKCKHILDIWSHSYYKFFIPGVFLPPHYLSLWALICKFDKQACYAFILVIDRNAGRGQSRTGHVTGGLPPPWHWSIYQYTRAPPCRQLYRYPAEEASRPTHATEQATHLAWLPAPTAVSGCHWLHLPMMHPVNTQVATSFLASPPHSVLSQQCSLITGTPWNSFFFFINHRENKTIKVWKQPEITCISSRWPTHTGKIIIIIDFILPEAPGSRLEHLLGGAHSIWAGLSRLTHLDSSPHPGLGPWSSF